MPKPNQITVASYASRQGVYVPYVRIYDAEPGKYGLMPKDFFIAFRTRDRKKAMERGKEMKKLLKGKTPDECREFLSEHCCKNWSEAIGVQPPAAI